MKTQLSKNAKAIFLREAKSLPKVARRTVSPVSENPPQRTVVVIDNSGSMADDDFPPNRLKAAQSSAIDFTSERAKRNPRDEIAVVSYETVARMECPLRSVMYLDEITRATRNISLGGLTAIGLGLRKAEQALLGTDVPGVLPRIWDWMSEYSPPPQPSGFVDRVVLLTDGHQSPGLGCTPLSVSERLKRAGVQIDCIGIGGDPSAVDEVLLRQIASINEVSGEPRYRFIKDRGALQKHFQELATGITR